MLIRPEDVQAAQRVVQNGIDEMNALTAKLRMSGQAAQTAATAPAGAVMAGNYDEASGAGRALGEVLNQLQVDLGKMLQQAEQGSSVATSQAQAGFTGGAASVTAGM